MRVMAGMTMRWEKSAEFAWRGHTSPCLTMLPASVFLENLHL